MGDGEKKLSFSCERLSTEEKGEARVEWLVRNGLFEVRDCHSFLSGLDWNELDDDDIGGETP